MQFGPDSEGDPQGIVPGDNESVRATVLGLTRVATVIRDADLPKLLVRYSPGRETDKGDGQPPRDALAAEDRGFTCQSGVVVSPIPEYPPRGDQPLQLVSINYAERHGNSRHAIPTRQSSSCRK